jgi:hypothetical protein
MLFEGIVNRFSKLGNAGRPFVRMSSLGSLAVANVEPELTEVTRAGLRFHGGPQTLGAGVASIVTIPTTTATFALYNNSGGARSIVVDKVALALASGATAVGCSLYGCIARPVTPPTANVANFSSGNLSGSSRASIALWTTALTVPVTTWSVILANLQATGANVGQGSTDSLKNGWIIPPFFALGLVIVNTNTTGLFLPYLNWSELELDLE